MVSFSGSVLRARAAKTCRPGPIMYCQRGVYCVSVCIACMGRGGGVKETGYVAVEDMIGDLAGRKLAGAEGRQGGGQGREGGGGARNRLCCCEDLTGDLAGGNLAEKM